MRQALDQAEIDGQLLMRRQPKDLLIDHREDFPAGHLIAGCLIGRCGHDGLTSGDGPRLAILPSQTRHPRPAGHPVRDAIEPGRDRIPFPERAGLAHQDEERRLECVFDVAGILQPSAADGQDHRAVSRDQLRKRRLIADGDKAVQQLALTEAGERTAGEQGAEFLDQASRSQLGHRRPSGRGRSLSFVLHRRPRLGRLFLGKKNQA